MNDSIICPHCKHSIPLSQAITHEIDEKYRIELEQERKKRDEELEAEKKRGEEERQKLISMAQKRIEEEKLKTAKETEENMKQKVQQEMEMKFKDAENARTELQNEKKQLQEQLLEMSKSIRKIQSDNEQKQIELEKKLAEEQQKIREEEHRRSDEQYRMKMMENEKKLQDAIKANEDLRRKLEQGSQQMQGEVLELAIENMLRQEFPFDEVTPVPKGITGADLIQIVKNQLGKPCGTIIWETKRTKAWSNEWVTKLKDDQRQVKAELAILITQALPANMKRFGLVDGVWVGDYECVLGLAYSLRARLLEVASIRLSSEGKKEKTEILYNYLAGTEFKHRVEAIVEAFSGMQDDIEKEKRWFTAKWAKQEKNIRRVIDNTLGMHGDLQSIMGNALEDIEGLTMLPEEVESSTKAVKKTTTTIIDAENDTLF